MPLSLLNEEQLNAATAKFGHNIVIASAGTGKTSTIVGRIACLLDSRVAPQEILLLTFTNKAATEMVERLTRFFPKDVTSKIEAGTFHAICYKLLKKHNPSLLLKQQTELKTLFRSIYEKREFKKLDYKTAEYSANYLYDIYSLYQNTELKLGFADWMCEKYPDHEFFCDIYEDISREYELTKESYGYINFNDLLIKTRDLLSTDIFVNFKEVLVDEYQDTNSLQGSLIDKMNPSSLFCVGDYDQSIFAFNGANINLIGTFSKKYPDSKVFSLKKNYRSTALILSLADRVIKFNDRIYPKELIVVRKDDPVSPSLLEFNELFEQYSKVSFMIKSSSTKHEDVAVIFRNNSSADGIEASLRELGVPCKRKGGKSFFDAKEVKALFDIYTFFVNPKDLMAFIHIFEYAKGLGSATAKDIFEALKKLGHGSVYDGILHPDTTITNPFEKRKVYYQLALFDDFFNLESDSKFSHLDLDTKISDCPILKHPKFTDESAKFYNAFYLLYKRINRIKKPLSMVEAISESPVYKYIIDILATKRALDRNKKVNAEVKERALVNIQRKIVLIKDLTKNYSDNQSFLNAMLLGSNELTKGEGVNLLTIHASKGLEFKNVYILDLMDGRFPNRKLAAKGGSIDEERRLFYVAVTRARDRLWLTYAKFDKVKKLRFVPSLFLYEAGLINNKAEYKKLLKEKES
ncbi:MAG: ATP-dependent helicase [Candidatus Scalindua sp.]|nr:ATP-dependent helicase [Candidatus Scalindua sp.]